MSSVALAVSLASSFTSLATTAKPLPASPARAASIVAFSASRLVCWAIDVITLMTLPMSALLSPSLATVVLVVLGDPDRVGGDARRLVRVLGDLADAGAHLLRAGRDGLDVPADLLRRGRHDVGLRRGLRGVRAHLLADGREFLRRGRERLRVVDDAADGGLDLRVEFLGGR